ncbi:hypothetical protein WH47_00562 [Habropoda laboriosa]|uniref:Uncharacterized protein n=1 Tax=Habropoda laboriosa TaxID=597456 RepID=A0A0L7R3Y7_9HYME|nr:hypothetical protein WH47_00562 [Habropoda laboriosa]
MDPVQGHGENLGWFACRRKPSYDDVSAFGGRPHGELRAAGALAGPTLQSFPRVDERGRGIGLHCDCVSVWSHWPTNCDYGRVSLFR